MDVKQLAYKPPPVDSSDSKKKGKINKTMALAMALEGQSDREIYTHFEVTKQALSHVLKPYRDQIEAFLSFTSNKATSLEWKQFKLNEALTDERIAAIKPYNLIKGMEKFEKIIRLDRGEATEIKRVEIAFDLSDFR